MNIEEIRKNKPEDATHYDPRGWLVYYKISKHCVFFWAEERNKWMNSSLTLENYKDYLSEL